MASSGTSLPQKQLQCPLCSLVFTNPVTTSCGHNFCQSCLQQSWDERDICECPTCSKSFSPRPEININLAFKELVDSFKSILICQTTAPPNAVVRPGDVVCDVCSAASHQVKALKSCLVCLTSFCSMHLEPHEKVSMLKMHKLIDPVRNLQERLCRKHDRLLEMFCRDEQKCVCRFCFETEHKDHQAVSLEEEGARKKKEINATELKFQNMIQERLKKEEEISLCLQLSKASSEKELENSHRLFTSLIESIQDRQTEVNVDVISKQEAAEVRAGQLIQDLRLEVQELETKNNELRQLQETDDCLHLIQRLPSLTSPPDSKDWSEVRVHSELCVGTLRAAVAKLQDSVETEFNTLKNEEMKRMQKYAVDVVLDPDTAHPNIVLSADGRQAGRGELLHVVPDIPQRFDPVICVLAKKGFLSGRFYFQVAVGSKTFWDLGVVLESVNRKGMITSKPENGFWTVRLRGGDEYRALDSPSVRLQLPDKPQTVAVFTDYEQGTVAFYNVHTSSHMYTFTGCGFTGKIYPFFSPGVCDDGKNIEPLIVIPINPET